MVPSLRSKPQALRRSSTRRCTLTMALSRQRCDPSISRSSSGRCGCVSSWVWCSRQHTAGEPRLTTCCCRGQPLRITSGPAIQHAGDLAAILSSLAEGEVLFLDEIHRMARPAEEMLYLAMEDFRVDVIVGKGPGATAIPLELPPFTLVGATTRAGMLPGPLRDRFGFTGHLDFYDPAELQQELHRSALLLKVQ